MFFGDQIYEPSEATGVVIIQPNYTYIVIPPMIAGTYITVMMIGYLILQRRGERRRRKEQIIGTNKLEPEIHEGADYEFLEKE